MDARHESLEQEAVNDMIHFINDYLCDHTDEILLDEPMRDEMKHLVTYLYEAVHQSVRVDDIFSKKNILSFDRILLPTMDEMVIARNGRRDFIEGMHHIATLLAQHRDHPLFYQTLQHILEVHGLR